MVWLFILFTLALYALGMGVLLKAKGWMEND